MSFVQRELEKIEKALHDPQYANTETYKELYATQQALNWALDPTMFRSPFDTVLDIRETTSEFLADPK